MIGTNQSKENPVRRPVPRRFLAGVILIVVSSAIGWVSLAAGGALAPLYGRIALKIGGAIYALSWVLLGIGVLLSGKDGITYAKRLIRRK